MNSKERVLTAINLSQPDRVPIDFNANSLTLKRLYHDFQVDTHKELLKFLHADIIDIRGIVDPVYAGPIPKEKIFDNGVKQNFWGMRTKAVETESGIEDSYCDFIMSQCQTIEELENHNWPSVDWFDFSDFSQHLEAWNDFAVMASGASVWQHPSFLRGLEAMMMDVILNPELLTFFLAKFTDFYTAYFDKMFTTAKGRIDIFRIADDLGTQSSLLFSQMHFNEFIAPQLQKLIDMAHSHDIKVMFHTCGSILPLIPTIIDLGVDILDPIQVSAANMNPDDIKNQFGASICLHGGIDTQFVLPHVSSDEVRDNVREIINILGKNGGYILAPCHVLQNDVPTENIRAMYEEGVKFYY